MISLTARSAVSLCQIIMNAIMFNRTAQRAFAIKEWLEAKSTVFSRLCGEDFTRKEVLLALLYTTGLLLTAGIAGTLEGGAL